ncbi:hypothetical protein [Aestuariispira insulae]|uniref:Uncharacterized protein n=1 Tax=Aestuariispira insulae TaxID=1461337 RepID=A0A3D9HTX6_9PROT|nr:hypothetical protein [Aestuariispira insulae]RED52326.1 hypothetical protein DFP90_102346 [Aestuariispira insulae]
MKSKDPGRKAGEKNYRYQLESVEVLEDASRIQSPMIRKFFNWWRSFGPELPGIDAFDSFPHDELQPNIFRVDVIGEGRFLFGGRGHMARMILGGKNTGSEFSTNLTEASSQFEQENAKLAQYYATVAKNRLCSHCQGTLMTLNFMDIGFESLDAPLGNAHGDITHIVGIIDTNPSNILGETEML